MVQVKFGKMRTKQTQTKLMAKKLRNVRAEIKEIKKTKNNRVSTKKWWFYKEDKQD